MESGVEITRRRLSYGVGVNDANYVTCPKGGAQCKLYGVWHCMLQRCYSVKYQKRNPTYIGCTVSSEWLLFSSFSLWMSGQDWQGKQLDKDLLFQGNKIYSENTCIFVDANLNSLIQNRSRSKGEYPTGVTLHKPSGKYVAQCSSNGKKINLGYFDNKDDAHEAYKTFKYELIAEIANKQSEPLKSALLAYNIDYNGN